MPLDEEVLQSYVERLLELQSERAENLTSDELREVAYDLGLTDDDLQAAAEVAEKGLQRGLGYLQHGRHDDAVTELEKAAALAPERTDILYAAARAYRERYRVRHRGDDRRAAEAFARRCLELDPTHDDCFRLLNDLDGTSTTTTPVTVVAQPMRQKSMAAILLALGVALFIAVVAVYLLARQGPPASVAVAPSPPAVVAEAIPSTTVAVPDVPGVPVQFVVPEALAGLELTARRSRLDYYSEGGFYKLEGAVVNHSRLELEELKAFVEVLDDSGTVVATDSATILSSHEANVRPGDVWVFDTLCRVAKPATKARVTLQDYEADPAASSYAKPEPVPVTWAFERPADLQVAVAERSSALTGSGYFQTEFAITNVGTRPIKLMKFQMRYLDAAGKQLATRDFYLTITSKASLPVGETWARATINQVAEGFKKYELVVIEAQ